MRFLGWMAVLALAAVAAVWFGGQEIARRTAQQLAYLSQSGAARVQQVTATGFPTHLGVVTQDLALTGPGGTSEWRLPRVEAKAPLWSPLNWSYDATLPQEIILSGMRFFLSGTSAGGRAELRAASSWPLRTATLELVAPALTYEPAAAPSLAAKTLRLNLREGTDSSYDLTGAVEDLSLPPGLAASLTPEARLPDTIETISFDAGLRFETPLLLGAAAPVVPRAIALRDARLLWAGRELSAKGDLAVDALGRPVGLLTLTVTDWQAWLEFVIEGKLVPEQLAPVLRSVAAMLGGGAGASGRLSLPLRFTDAGVIMLGPVPLGPSPVLR